MAVTHVIPTLKNWQNVGEPLFGGDLNTNFNTTRDHYNAHSHDEFGPLAGDPEVTGLWTFDREGPPFNIGESSEGQMVEGLSVELLGEFRAADVLVRDREEEIEGDYSFLGGFHVEGDASFGGLVDGVNVSEHNHSGLEGMGERLSHGHLKDLGEDDHLQYMHIAEAREVEALHDFRAEGGPFLVTGPAAGNLVTGLNAQLLGGEDLDEVKGVPLMFSIFMS